MARLGLRRRTWQAAKRLGEMHAIFDPSISEYENGLSEEDSIQLLFAAEGPRRELKHLSTGRKRKQNAIP